MKLENLLSLDTAVQGLQALVNLLRQGYQCTSKTLEVRGWLRNPKEHRRQQAEITNRLVPSTILFDRGSACGLQPVQEWRLQGSWHPLKNSPTVAEGGTATPMEVGRFVRTRIIISGTILTSLDVSSIIVPLLGVRSDCPG